MSWKTRLAQQGACLLSDGALHFFGAGCLIATEVTLKGFFCRALCQLWCYNLLRLSLLKQFHVVLLSCVFTPCSNIAADDLCCLFHNTRSQVEPDMFPHSLAALPGVAGEAEDAAHLQAQRIADKVC